jgi:hypothetical protein
LNIILALVLLGSLGQDRSCKVEKHFVRVRSVEPVDPTLEEAIARMKRQEVKYIVHEALEEFASGRLPIRLLERALDERSLKQTTLARRSALLSTPAGGQTETLPGVPD